MNSAIASISKNILLLSIVALSTLNFFYGWFNWKELIQIQFAFGALFIFFSCYELLNSKYRASLPHQMYPYFPFSLIALRFLKACIFVTFALMLYTSGSRAKYLYVICLIIAANELVVLYIKYKKGLSYVSIFSNYILFAETSLKKVFASELEIIEFRHDIFYFVKKDKKTFQIKLIHIAEKQKLVTAIQNWIIENNAPVGIESREKILKAR